MDIISYSEAEEAKKIAKEALSLASSAGGKTIITKTFNQDEELVVELPNNIKSPHIIGVTKEVQQINKTNNKWNVTNSTFEIENFASDTSITPSAVDTGTFTLGSGNFTADNVGMLITGNGGVATLTATDGSFTTTTPFNSLSEIASGDWKMEALKVDDTGVHSLGIPHKHFPAITGNSGQIDTRFWVDLNNINTTESLDGQSINYALSTNNKNEWFVNKSGAGQRPIARNNNSTWEYNNEISESGVDTTSLSTKYEDNQSISLDNGNIIVAHRGNNNIEWLIIDNSANVISTNTLSNPDWESLYRFSGIFDFGDKIGIIGSGKFGDFYIGQGIVINKTDGSIIQDSTEIYRTDSDWALVSLGYKHNYSYMEKSVLLDNGNLLVSLSQKDFIGILTQDLTLTKVAINAFTSQNNQTISKLPDGNIIIISGYNKNYEYQILDQSGNTVQAPVSFNVDGEDVNINDGAQILSTNPITIIYNKNNKLWKVDIDGTYSITGHSLVADDGTVLLNKNPIITLDNGNKLLLGRAERYIIFDSDLNLIKYTARPAEYIKEPNMFKQGSSIFVIGKLNSSDDTLDNAIKVSIRDLDFNELYSFVDVNKTIFPNFGIFNLRNNMVKRTDNEILWFFMDYTGTNSLSTISISDNALIGYQATFSTNTEWVSATINSEFQALSQAMSVSTNRMNKLQLEQLTDAELPTLTDTLDLSIIPYTEINGNTPVSDGLSINYDANVMNKMAVPGVDYEYDSPADTTLRFKSLIVGNLKIGVM